MATSPLPFTPTEVSQHGIIEYLRLCTANSSVQWDLRDKLRAADLVYQREVDRTVEQHRARNANRVGDPTKFQNVVIPVVAPQIESAVTYQSAVFLQGYPIFGVISDPTNIDIALQMDTIIGEQQIKGGWVNELIKTFRDGFKYNLSAVECAWARETSVALETASDRVGVDTKEVKWEGNVLTRRSLYNTFWDTRVSPDKASQHGDFQGYFEMYSKIRLKTFIASLPLVFNVKKAFESGSTPVMGDDAQAPGNFYVPRINDDAFVDIQRMAGFDWAGFMGVQGGKQSKFRENIAYKEMYQVTTLYARILPSDFNIRVTGYNTPQIWKFVIVNNQVLIYAERMTNAHNYLPIQIAQPLDDGLEYQTKSFLQNVQPIQEIATALSNSMIAARRRAISDRLIYDPSRISASQINNDIPNAKMAVKPSAFGKPLSEAVYPLPFRDDQSQTNGAEMQQYLAMANMISGNNPARQGQFVKGNKTRSEFDTTMANSNGRDQLVAMGLECTLFTPVKAIVLSNIIQYQGGVTLYNREKDQTVTVDPVALRKALITFKVADGLISSEKVLDSESLAMAFQTLQAVPALAQEYNLGPMFSYLMKQRGAKISPFEKSSQQIQYEQAMAQYQMTVQTIAMSLQKLPDATPETIEAALKKLPPQPTPDQFGFDPKNPNVKSQAELTGGKSIMDQIMANNGAGAGGGSTPEQVPQAGQVAGQL